MTKDERIAAVIIDLKDDALTIGQIAEKHGIAYKTVWELAKKPGITNRPVGRPWGSKTKK